MFRNHPQRDLLEKELQQRFFPVLPCPCHIGHFMLTLNNHSRSDELTAINALIAPYGKQLSEYDTDLECQLGPVLLRWERHTEFSSYSFIATPSNPEFGPIEQLLPFPDFFAQIPGQLFRVVQLICISKPQPALPATGFSAAHAISSLVADGGCQIWTDFRKHPEGGGRVLLWDQGMQQGARARLVQQLFDLGNYRKLSLLGSPISRQGIQQWQVLEQQLLHITERIEQQQDNDEQLLRELSQLSANGERLVASSANRLEASQAYYQLTLDRLKSVKEQPIEGYMSLQDFSERRLTPAFRTIQSLQSRQQQWLARLSRSTDLLRTRISLALQRQNTNLLASMERRARQQLALQRTVERISVVAISYYALQLLEKWRESASEFFPWLGHKSISLGLMPLVVVIVSVLLWRLHRHSKP